MTYYGVALEPKREGLVASHAGSNLTAPVCCFDGLDGRVGLLLNTLGKSFFSLIEVPAPFLSLSRFTQTGWLMDHSTGILVFVAMLSACAAAAVPYDLKV